LLRTLKSIFIVRYSVINDGYSKIGIHHNCDINLENSKIYLHKANLSVGLDYGFFDGGLTDPRLSNCKLHLKNAELHIYGNVNLYQGAGILIQGGKLYIGNGTRINGFSNIICKNEIRIGENCLIAQDVNIRDDDGHSWGISESDLMPRVSPVSVGNNVWIARGVSVLKGSEICDGAMIAAGALVTGHIPPKTMAAGIPAKVIKENIYWKA
jgi:acetyltransferase-like isoleucine patch superfamily enzyme